MAEKQRWSYAELCDRIVTWGQKAARLFNAGKELQAKEASQKARRAYVIGWGMMDSTAVLTGGSRAI
jgi:hypothetical protein